MVDVLILTMLSGITVSSLSTFIYALWFSTVSV